MTHTHKELLARVKECLSLGGLFNPESMHPQDAVRDLIIDLGAAILDLTASLERERKAREELVQELHHWTGRAEQNAAAMQEAHDGVSQEPRLDPASAAAPIAHSKSQYKRLVAQGAIKPAAVASPSVATGDSPQGASVPPAAAPPSEGACHECGWTNYCHSLECSRRTKPAAATVVSQGEHNGGDYDLMATCSPKDVARTEQSVAAHDEALRIEGMEIAAKICISSGARTWLRCAENIRAEIARRNKEGKAQP